MPTAEWLLSSPLSPAHNPLHPPSPFSTGCGFSGKVVTGTGCEMVFALPSWAKNSSFCGPVRPVRFCRLMSCLQQTQGSVPRGLSAPREPRLLNSQPAGAEGTLKSWSPASCTSPPGSACAGAENPVGRSAESLKASFKFPETILCFTLSWPEFYLWHRKEGAFFQPTAFLGQVFTRNATSVV